MFVGMLCASFAAMQAGVLAKSGYEHYIYDFCDGWVDGDGYDCEDWELPRNGSRLRSERQLRLYGHEDKGYRLEVAGYYIDDAWYALTICAIQKSISMR